MKLQSMIAGAVLLLSFDAAFADTYTSVQFSGGIFGGRANVSAPFNGVVSAGETFAGSFVYDNSLIPPSGAGYYNVLLANFPMAVPPITFAIGGKTLTITDPFAAVQYNHGRFNGFALNQDFTFAGTSYELSVSGGIVSVHLLSDLLGHSYVNGYINIGDGNLTNRTAFVPPVAAIPEPATWVLLILGFAGVGLLSLRRRHFAVSAA